MEDDDDFDMLRDLEAAPGQEAPDAPAAVAVLCLAAPAAAPAAAAAAAEPSPFGRGDGSQRSRAELLLLAATGRAARMANKLREEAASQAVELERYTQRVNICKSGRAPRLHVFRSKRRRRFPKLGVLVQRGKGKSSKFKLSWHEMLRMCFGSAKRSKTADGEQYDISRHTVNRVVMVMGHTLGARQLEQLEALAVAAENLRPQFAVVCYMWDETSHTLKLPAVGHATPQQQSSSWPTLVSKVRVSFGSVCGHKFYHEVVMPPIPLPSNAARHIYNGLWHHPLTAPIFKYLQRILLASHKRCIVHEVASAAALVVATAAA